MRGPRNLKRIITIIILVDKRVSRACVQLGLSQIHELRFAIIECTHLNNAFKRPCIRLSDFMAAVLARIHRIFFHRKRFQPSA